MPFDRFLIAPLNSGLKTNMRPWLIPDDAWETLINVYNFRGRIRKRFGTEFIGITPNNSRLRINLGNTDGSGNASGTVPGGQGAIGQQFSVGSEIFTVYQANGSMLDTGTATVKTFNTSTGAYVINGAAINTALYWYPALPVMALATYDLSGVDDQPLYAFDTRFAYTFNNGFSRSVNTSGPLTGVPIFNGNNLNFFWTCNWLGQVPGQIVLFVTNFNVAIGTASLTDDPIYAFNGTSWQPFSYLPTALNSANQQPYTVTQTNTGTPGIITNYVQSSLIIIQFKNRLLLLNTVENNANGATAFNSATPTTTGITPTNYVTSTNTQFKNRCRYSANQSPFAPNSWLEPNFVYIPDANTGTSFPAVGAGFIDAATEEAIVSAEFIKDRLIVYFERSTWEIAYTGNQVFPFVWQKINTELGSESAFSTVPFDKVILTIGQTGVHACNGSNVERIDNDIPDEVFQIKTANENNDGIQRVYGIRDYYVEMVYWTIPSTTNIPATYPNQVLVFNYTTGTWALNEDCITCFGYFFQQADITWSTIQGTWEENNETWNSGIIEPQVRQVIGGNQEGFVFTINADISSNASTLQITNIVINGSGIATLTVIDHTMQVGQYVRIDNAQGITLPDQGIYLITQIVDANTIILGSVNPFSGTYLGGGTLARVSNILMKSKWWNPYIAQGRDFYLAKIDFGVLATSAGQVVVDYFPSSTSLSMIQEGGSEGTNMLMGNSILETSPYAFVPLESYQQTLWHPIYFQTQGEFIQIQLSMNNEQITTPDIANADFELQGLVLHTQTTSYRLE